MSSVAIALARCSKELKLIKFYAVLNDLLALDIIEYDEFVENVRKTVQEKLLFLQEKLPQKGDSAFPSFIQVLHKHDHGKLADTLDQGESWTKSTKYLTHIK